MLRRLGLNLSSSISHYGSVSQLPKRAYARLPSVDDVKDAKKILLHDLTDGRLEEILPCPRECDVLIIGGSVIGSSIAFFLKEHQNQLNVMVVEPDSTYSQASALLSAGGMRQQFSCKENIEMSQFGFDFLRRSADLLDIDGEKPPDVQFNHGGYLILADKDGADQMLKSHQVQKECGAVNKLLTQDMLKEKYPWVNAEGVELASVGLQGEGWLDPAALLSALKGKAKWHGTKYIEGKVVGFEYAEENATTRGRDKILDMTLVELPNGDIQPVRAGAIVNAAGAWAGQIAAMAGIGNEDIDEDCSMPLPVEPRKRFIYSFHCPDGPTLDCGLCTDTSEVGGGVYWRREGLGGNYICGMSPPEEQEHDHSDLEVDYDFFDNEIWPKLAHRVPAFEGLKMKSAWAGYYDYNYADHNLIIGHHPYFKNFYLANGSTGHGLQHAPAIGRCVSELIIYNEFRTIKLDSFGFNRFLSQDKALESERNVY